jgi:hypothetical protein
VKKRLGQIWGQFEGLLAVRYKVLGQEKNIRLDLVLFEEVLGYRINI